MGMFSRVCLVAAFGCVAFSFSDSANAANRENEETWLFPNGWTLVDSSKWVGELTPERTAEKNAAFGVAGALEGQIRKGDRVVVKFDRDGWNLFFAEGTDFSSKEDKKAAEGRLSEKLSHALGKLQAALPRRGKGVRFAVLSTAPKATVSWGTAKQHSMSIRRDAVMGQPLPLYDIARRNWTPEKGLLRRSKSRGTGASK